MSRYDEVCEKLRKQPRKWCVTGAAGFIGSHLTEKLLELKQEIVGIDNFSTGHRENLKDFEGQIQFIEGDINDDAVLTKALKGCDYVLHQAALGSVPRSIVEPQASNFVNVDGSLAVLIAARDAGVQRVVFASSSSVYGDAKDLPMREEVLGNLLSPYAATKRINELYAGVFSRTYGLNVVGLRYFNVFGARQDPNGAYAAVIPRWIASLIKDEKCVIYGDGQTSRDFCYVGNIVQANILAACSSETFALFNIACGETTTLNVLYDHLAKAICGANPPKVSHQEFRKGDILHSFADISLARSVLGYEPQVLVGEGLQRTVRAYMGRLI